MPIKDLTNMKFGRLKVIKYSHSNNDGRAMWLCNCDCGNNNIVVNGKYLRNGDTKSCGCLTTEGMKELIEKNKKHNKITIVDDTVHVGLKDDKEFLCDVRDIDICKNSYWYFNNNGYARSVIKEKTFLFHNCIIKTNQNEEIDHINGNRLDNRRKNLRIVNHLDNMKNKGIYSNNKSGTSGVYFNKNTGKWAVYIQSMKVQHYLGEYYEIADAIKIRKEAELKYFGEYRRKT